MSKKTQKERVFDYIREHGSITTIEAFNMVPPITRLASRIFELQADGVPIDRMTVIKKKNGESVHFTRYTLGVDHVDCL